MLRISMMTQEAMQVLWEAPRKAANQWTFVNVKNLTSSKFELFFEAKKGKGPKAMVAIDDVDIDLHCIGTHHFKYMINDK